MDKIYVEIEDKVKNDVAILRSSPGGGRKGTEIAGELKTKKGSREKQQNARKDRLFSPSTPICLVSLLHKQGQKKWHARKYGNNEVGIWIAKKD